MGSVLQVFYGIPQKRVKMEPHNVICIGDSVEHDIRGSFNANCSSALVKTGIAATKKEEELINSLNFSDTPNFIIPAFSF